MRICLAALTLALAGCNLYFGGDDEPPPCTYTVDDGYIEYRDPLTASCGPAPGAGCDSSCGACGSPASPDEGRCYSECTGLAETTCLGTGGCYAAYVEAPGNDGPPDFEGCWETAPSGPVQGSCEGLDAYSCSRHDDCSLAYVEAAGSTKFAACIPEPSAGSCAAVDCGPGYQCEERCYSDTDPLLRRHEVDWCASVCVPDAPTCTNALCAPGTECVEACEYVNGQLQCGSSCVPTHGDPGSCTGNVACAMPAPACPAGTTAGRSNGCWTGYCIPTSACGPSDPGACYVEVACDEQSPACPAQTTPGVIGACWSGYCIPESQCAAAACETLDTEAACLARQDCIPAYIGTNCTCYPDGCSCGTLTFGQCESWLL